MVSIALVAMAGVAQLVITLVHQSRGAEQARSIDSLQGIDEFVELTRRTRTQVALAGLIGRTLESQISVPEARLFTDDGEEGLVEVGDGDKRLSVDRRVRAWLIANESPLVVEDLATKPMGGLREPIEAFVGSVGAEVVAPVVDRGRLVGLIAAAQPAGKRTLRGEQLDILAQIAAATGNALTYLELFQEAAERVEVAREVEVASAVQAARASGERRIELDGCIIDSHYQPASQFGGDWWACHELSDGRVLVAIGDVTGHGVPAALVSFTVEGAVETAQRMFGGWIEVIALLDLLNDLVCDVGGTTYSMTCFVAVFDFEAGEVTFSNAGHPFPYICRRRGESGTELRSMVSRGTPLGAVNPVFSAATMELEPEDVIIFYSDALVESQDPDGAQFGERRLQRVLRRHVRDAGEHALDVIINTAQSHYEATPIVDDITVLVLRTRGE
jgi:serine phosphatase RsbU (regulator of sigma subunit)